MRGGILEIASLSRYITSHVSLVAHCAANEGADCVTGGENPIVWRDFYSLKLTCTTLSIASAITGNSYPDPICISVYRQLRLFREVRNVITNKPTERRGN